MAMSLVSTVTIGSGGAASATVSNIPQTGKDLLVLASCRTAATGASGFDSLNMAVNGSTQNGTVRYLYRISTTVASGAESGQAGVAFGAQRSDTTSNTFASAYTYITNYTTTTQSQASDGVTENNGNDNNIIISAFQATSPVAITSLTFTPASGTNLLQHSTISVYIIS